MRRRSGIAATFCLFTIILSGQQKADRRSLYERVYAIVPMVGSGTWADPMRPMFAPTPGQTKPGDRNGIIAFHHQLSDDGQFALVEYVAANRSALAPVLTQLKQGALASEIQIFERTATTPQQLETAFKARKKEFDFSKFQLVVQ